MNGFERFREIIESVTPIAKDLATSYANRDKVIDTTNWIAGEIVKRTTGVSAESAQQTGAEIMSAIENFSTRLSNIRESCSQGKTKEAWLTDYLIQNAGEDIQKAGDYLNQVQAALQSGNNVAAKTLLPDNGEINVEDLMKNAEEGMEVSVDKIEWNKRTFSELAMLIGKQATIMGRNSVADDYGVITGLDVGNGEQIILPKDIVETEEGSSFDHGFKTIITAALSLGLSKGKLSVLSKTLPVNVIANLACFGVEGIKCIGKVATGKLSTRQAIEHMGRSSISVVADLCMTGLTKGLSAGVFASVPVFGPVLSMAASSYLGKLTTSHFGKIISNGCSMISPVAKSLSLNNLAKSAVTGIANKVSRILNI